MVLPKYNAKDIQIQCQNADVLQKTVQQINKDLSTYRLVIELDVHAKNAFEQLVNKLTIEVNQMIQQNSKQFFALLYRIDVSEKRVNEVLSKHKDHARHLALILIEREVVKALTKANFRP